ncbi:MAG: hypothetical protein K2V38_18885 [Gemmataceae bacterium]|nr:hypothetical protein [Gemmataceae bacterium]
MSDKPDIGISENEKVELAKTMLAVRSIASAEDFQKVRDILVPTAAKDAVDRAVQGLSKEDEFAMMCRLMGTATHLVHQEQRPVIDGDYLVPDFLARFQPDCTPLRKSSSDSQGGRCFVEVKSTEDNSFKVGGQKLRRLRAFADQFGFPLLFAVRFLRFGGHALWVIVEDDRSRNSLKITYGDLGNGVRHVLWDDFFYRVNPWICFREVYDSSATDESGYRHPTRGVLREFHIVSEPDHPMTGPGGVENTAIFTGLDAATFNNFFDCFRLKELGSEQRGHLTSALLEPTMPCCIADLIYQMNRLPRDEHGQAILDPSRVLVAADGGPPINRDFIRSIVKMVGAVTLHVIAFGPPDEQLQKWQRFGGKA